MKKTILFIAIAFSAVTGFSQGNCTINPDGIYIAKVDSNTNAYLRFFAGDSAITTTSNIPRRASHKHIVKEYKEFILHGKYKIKGCFIRINLEGISGKAKMEGYIMGDNIGLSKINLQNNTYTDLVFFYKEY